MPEISAIDATNYLNQQVVVTDKVVGVALRSSIWLLHLNQKFPNSPLNCVVRGAHTNDFPNFEKYLGQRIIVTGRITDFRGRLELVLTSTNQIQLASAMAVVPKPVTPAAEPQAKAAAAVTPTAMPTATLASATQPVPTPAVKPAEDSNHALGWILGLLAVISALLAMGIFLMWRRTATEVRAIRPANTVARLTDAAQPESVSVLEWKQRALVAEAMAGQQGQMLREKIMPELTEFAKQSLVQGLYAQRNALLETHQEAQLALAEMESRLVKIQAPLHERIRAYEQRIVELEREVDTQGDE
ncbi:MAG TPA: hypothetical protein VK815_02060, partial [Candidatus Acidoferrales bacterium]|nr:hypothetical protein [Candidatus Acidoferrales bacterium]